MGNFYNPEIKEEFLQSKAEDSRSTYSHVFKKSEALEELVEKDLFNFSLNQIGAVMESLELASYSAARTYGRVISSYLNWAFDKGYRKEENELKEIGNIWFDKYATNLKLYLSEDELFEVEEQLVNYQDKVLLRLLFEGVNGFDSSELLNLRYENVNFETGQLLLKDDRHGERSISVSNTAIKYIEKALEEETYYNKNGTATGRRTTSTLEDSPYVIKATVSKARVNPNERAEKHTIYRRLTVISDLFEITFLTAKNLEKSGMIKMGKDLYLEHGKLDKPQLKQIAEHFGMRKTVMNGYEVFNYTVLRQFVHLGNIEELYGDLMS